MPRKKAPDPPPEALAELFEALDLMEAAARELKRQKRALFPAISAHRRAIKRVREVWRSARGLPSAEGPRPLLDAMAAAHGNGSAPSKGARNIRGTIRAPAAPMFNDDGFEQRPDGSLVVPPPLEDDVEPEAGWRRANESEWLLAGASRRHGLRRPIRAEEPASKRAADPMLKKLRGREAYASAKDAMDGAAATNRKPPKRIKGRVTRSDRSAGVEA